MAPCAPERRDIHWARRIHALAQRFPRFVPAWLGDAARFVLPLESIVADEIGRLIGVARPRHARLIAGYFDGAPSAFVFGDDRPLSELHREHMLDILRTAAIYLESGRALPGTEATDRVRLIRTPNGVVLVVDFAQSAHERMARARPRSWEDALLDIP